MDERELTGTNVDVDVGVVEEVISHLLNFSWPGGRPHEDLSCQVCSVIFLLVQHQVGSPLEVHLANLQEVNQPSWCSNHYLSS